jgi:chromate transporter
MHRFLHDQQHWLTNVQFSSSIALAQAAPGPNVLFVALLGWQVGLNGAGGAAAGWHVWPTAFLGVIVSMVAILLPSSLLTYAATRWAHRNQQLLVIRAFKQGLAPVVVALMLATGWLLSTPSVSSTLPLAAHLTQWLAQQPWLAWALSASVALLVWKTRVHMLWLLGAGATLGALGLI